MAVRADQDGQREGYLRPQAHGLLKLAACEQVEELLRGAKLDICLEHHGIVALQERVEEFMQPDRRPLGVPFREIVPGQELLHREVGGDFDELLEGELREPFMVVAHLGPLAVQDPESLICICLGVRHHLLTRKARPGFVLVGWVADQRSEGSDDKDDLMPKLLELPQLAHRYRVAEVQVWRGGIISTIDPQGYSARLRLEKPLPKLVLHGVLELLIPHLHAAHKDCKLIFDAEGFLHRTLLPGSDPPSNE